MTVMGTIGGLGLGLYMGAGMPGQPSGESARKGGFPMRGVDKEPGKNPRMAAGSGMTGTAEDFRRMLEAPEGLERRKEFLNWLDEVKIENWKESWGLFAEATKGRSMANLEELNQLLTRIGEVAGQEGMEFFAAMEAKYGMSPKSNVVMASWAAKDPDGARKFSADLPAKTEFNNMFAGYMESALILGTGRHSVESLKELADSLPVETILRKGGELMASARQRGEVTDGEAIWRKYQQRQEEAHPGAPKDAGRLIFSELMSWKSEAAKTSETGPALFPWVEGLMDEGFPIWEDALAQVSAAAAVTAPAETLQWASDIAAKLFADLDQQQRVTRQQGFEAAKSWAETDPEGLSRWLTANPDHLAYDTGAAALYKTLRDSDPATASAWGAVVKDVSLRQWVKLPP